MNNFTFNGIRKEYIRLIERNRPYWSRRNIEVLSINGKSGGYVIDTKTDVLNIPITIRVEAENHEQLLERAEELAEWLVTEETKELTFDDQPNRSYFAILEGTIDVNEIVSFSTISINFLCPDPFKYGEEKIAGFSSDAFSFEVEGNETTLPIIELEVQEPLSFIDIYHQPSEEYIRIGNVPTAEEETYNPKELVFSTNGSSTVGWGVATEVDNGAITGNIQGTPNGFMVDSIGTAMNPKQWQGPSIKTSLDYAVQDFQMDVLVDLINREKNGTAMIEIYLLDADNNVVSKVGIEDIWPGFAQNQTKFQLGDIDLNNRYTHYTQADWKPAWTNFRGMLRITREGQLIKPYYAPIDENGNHYWSSSWWKYLDIEQEHQTPITQIQIALRAWTGTNRDTMIIREIKLWELNRQPELIANIANEGDRIQINHKNKEILINGENRNDLKDFASNFFELSPGENRMFIFPENAVQGTVRWRSRYK